MDIDQWALAAIAAKFMIYSAAFMAVGTALFWLFCDPQKKLDIKYGRWIFWTSIIAIGFTLVRVGVRAGVLIDDGWAGMIDPDMLQLAVEGKVGQSAILRLIGLLLLMIGLLFTAQRSVLFVLGAVAVSASFALVGHATGEPRWALTAIIALHLLLVSFWLGALAPLHFSSRTDPTSTASIAHQFGKQASIAVPVLIVAGFAFIAVRFGNPVGLIGSAYGWVLLAKLAAVAGLLALAAANKLRFVPKMMNGEPGAPSHLRRSIQVEALAFAAIFVVTAVLTTITQLPG